MHVGRQRVRVRSPAQIPTILRSTVCIRGRRRNGCLRCANSSRGSDWSSAAATRHTRSDYAKLLERCKGRADVQLLQTVMLRSLRQAVYSPENLGHFGLAYEAYTHFTSPIRRYPDLLIHRSIKAVLKNRRYEPGDWHELGMQCSQTERRADDATRDVEAWLKCYYMRDRVGEVFAGTISAAVAFGIFVALDNVYVEGLVHISDLGSDYFHFDAGKHQLIGERTGKRYRLGDRVTVVWSASTSKPAESISCWTIVRRQSTRDQQAKREKNDLAG